MKNLNWIIYTYTWYQFCLLQLNEKKKLFYCIHLKPVNWYLVYLKKILLHVLSQIRISDEEAETPPPPIKFPCFMHTSNYCLRFLLLPICHSINIYEIEKRLVMHNLNQSQIHSIWPMVNSPDSSTIVSISQPVYWHPVLKSYFNQY